jgi:hypothetical protein
MSAKGYKALSNIQHGEEQIDKETGQITNVVTEFPYGSIVTGLDDKTMAELWRVGVLEEVIVAPEPKVTVTRTVTTPADPPAAPVVDGSEQSPTS